MSARQNNDRVLSSAVESLIWAGKKKWRHISPVLIVRGASADDGYWPRRIEPVRLLCVIAELSLRRRSDTDGPPEATGLDMGGAWIGHISGARGGSVQTLLG